MAHWESHWIATATNGKCMGLVGVCATTFRECRVAPRGAACQATRARLLDGHYNLRVAASMITENRRFCERKTGQSKFRHWLASYQGLNRRGAWCGQREGAQGWHDVPTHRLVRRVIERRRELIAKCAR
jgi:hypothetical protein